VRHRSPTPIVIAVAIGAILVAGGVATVVIVGRPSESQPIPLAPTPPLTGESTVTAPPAASSAIDPATCALQQQPGPADPAPVGGDLMDVADEGSGRWRLCLTEPDALVVEGSAQCTWTPDRSAVRAIAGLPLKDRGGAMVDGGVSLDPVDVYLGLTSQAGDVLSFEDTTGRQHFDAAADGGSGAVDFALQAVVDPEHPPSVGPADRTGTMRWACGKAPPPRPGRSTGSVDLSLDDPVAGSWHVTGICSWVTTPTGARMQHVETDPSGIQRKAVKIGIAVDVDVSRPDQSAPSLWVDTGASADVYEATDPSLAIRQAGNGSSGLLRFRRLTISPDSDVRIEGDIREVSGAVGWTCLPPATPGPRFP